MPRSDTGSGLWLSFEHRLTEAVIRLEPRDFIIIEDSASSPHFYVQFAMQTDNALKGECAGPVRAGGTADWTRQQEAALLDLGWGDVDERGGWPNYRIFWSPERAGRSLSRRDAEDAAQITRRTFEEVVRAHNPSELKVHLDNFDSDADVGTSAQQWRLTGSERKALMEAVQYHQRRGARTSDGFGDGGVASFFKGLANFAEDLFVPQHQSIIDALESTDAPSFDPKTRLLLLDAIDLYARSGVSPGTARSLADARAKFD